MAKLAPPYSSHVCLGGWDAGADADGRADLGSVDAPWARLVRNQKERTCLFRNVCFDGKSSGSGSVGWTYYAQPHEFTGARRFRAGVDIWARGDFARMGEVSEDHTFALLRSAVPEHASWLPTHTVVKLAPLAPSNFGHFLGNALYPAFVAAWRMFGETTKALPLQLLLVGPNQTDPRSMRARCLRWAQHQQLADNRRRRRYQPQLPKPRLALDAQLGRKLVARPEDGERGGARVLERVGARHLYKTVRSNDRPRANNVERQRRAKRPLHFFHPTILLLSY